MGTEKFFNPPLTKPFVKKQTMAMVKIRGKIILIKMFINNCG